MTEAAVQETSSATASEPKAKRAKKAAKAKAKKPTKAKATKAKATKKAGKAKSSGTKVDYKKWPQCKTCKRHISNMTRHNTQHKTGEIGDDGKRTAKGLKAAASAKKAASKKK